MGILLILLAIIVIIIIIVLIKYYTDPEMRKAANILIEYEEKKKAGKTNDDDLFEYIKSSPDDGSDEWLDNASEIILNDENYIDDDYITSDDLEDILIDLEEYSDGGDYIELPIRGINHRNLTNDNIGHFDGYIAPDKNNKYDEYAIAIYGNDGTHFGFIEKGQELLYTKIEDSGGIINVSIDVNPFTNDRSESRLYGTITIDKEDLI